MTDFLVAIVWQSQYI